MIRYPSFLVIFLILIVGISLYQIKFSINENEIGKVLIDNDYPFALIKYLDENFDEKVNFKTKEATIIVKKPYWIN